MSTLKQLFRPKPHPTFDQQPLPATLTRIPGRDGADSDAGDLPLVTVITVVLNAKATLGRTLASMSRQTYPRIEHIIIDGGSNDGSLGIIKNAAGVSAWSSEPDTGIYDAMNKGIAAARGQYIAMLNADDWYEPQTIECAVQSLRTSGRGFVFGDLEYHFPNGTPRARRAGDPDYTRMLPGKVPATWHPTMVCTRESFERIGLYRTDLRIAADLDWQVRAFNNGIRGIYDPRVVTHHWGGGISSMNQRMAIKEGFVCAMAGRAWAPSTFWYWSMRYAQVRSPNAFRKSKRGVQRLAASLNRTKTWPSTLKEKLPFKPQLKRVAGMVGGAKTLQQKPVLPAESRSPSPLLAFASARDECGSLTDSAIELLIARAPGWSRVYMHDPSDSAAAVRVVLSNMGIDIIEHDENQEVSSTNGSLDLVIAPSWDRERAMQLGARECIVHESGSVESRVPLQHNEHETQAVLSLCACRI